MKSIGKVILPLAAIAAFQASAGFYWLHEGKLSTGRLDDAVKGQGWASVLTLTNDVEGIEYKRIQIHDIRLESNGSTRFVKYNANSGNAPFDGCRYGEAVVDLTLPIRRADGSEYTLVGLYQQAFSGNNYIGKVILPETIEYIDDYAFRNCYYLRTVVMPNPRTWRPVRIGTTTGSGRAFEGCSRLEDPIAWPDSLGDVAPYTFSGDSRLKGFSGAGVTNVYGGAFHGTGTGFTLEMGSGEIIRCTSYNNQGPVNNNNLRTIIWHETPPCTGDAFSKASGHFMSQSSTARVHYIPYDATTESGAPAAWESYREEFLAETSGNAMVFPVYDPETGAQTDGSWYVSGRADYADKIRFWFPDAAMALLMK